MGFLPELMTRDAVISDDGVYRYRLVRCWEPAEDLMHVVMLNPSTADHKDDDPTIRRLIGFAKREGCGGINVMNLYAYRATEPAVLRGVVNPIGPQNRYWLRQMAKEAMSQGRAVICAWGDFENALPFNMGSETMHMFRTNGVTLKCFGMTVSRFPQPRHPLYIAADVPLQIMKW